MTRDRAALALYQKLPLEDKIQHALDLAVEWLEVNPASYISFSGGKDSTVLRDIVHRVDPSIPAVYCDTRLEYPGVRAFAMERADIVIKPAVLFNEVIKTCGYPVVSKEVAKKVSEARNGAVVATEKLHGTHMNGDVLSTYNCDKWGFLLDAPFRISPKCCDTMKKHPFIAYERETGRKPFVGMLAKESKARETGWIKTGCNFQTMKYTDRHRYDYCIGGGEVDSGGMWIPNKTGLGLGFVLDYLHVPY